MYWHKLYTLHIAQVDLYHDKYFKLGQLLYAHVVFITTWLDAGLSLSLFLSLSDD